MRTPPLPALLLALAFPVGSAHGQIKAPDQETGSPRCTLVSTVDTSGPIPAQGAIGGLAVDALGRMYVATFRSAVYRIETDGTRTLLNNSFVNASGNSIDNNGELLQSDYKTHELFRVHQDGSRTLIANGFTGPVGVVMDASGDIFVANYSNHTISRVSPAGLVSLFSASPLLNGPNGMVISDTGVIYVANLDDNRLLRLNPDGTANIVAPIGPGSANAHVTWLNGKLYVSKIFAHRVYEVTTGGDVKLLAGTGISGTTDGCAPDEAKFSFPNGIAAAPTGNVIYTNDFVGFMGGPRGTIRVRSIHLQ